MQPIIDWVKDNNGIEKEKTEEILQRQNLCDLITGCGKSGRHSFVEI